VKAEKYLYEPNKLGNLKIWLVFTLDERYKYDKEWLKNMAAKVLEVCKSPDVPEDMRTFATNLADTNKFFSYKVGVSVAGDTEVWCCTYAVDNTKELPKLFLPNEELLPFIVLKQPLEEKNYISLTTGKLLGLVNKDLYA
jgi:hypothetical protein